MPHFVFVINPVAGKGGQADDLTAKISRFFEEKQTGYTVYHTTGRHDAYDFTKNFSAGQEAVCFIACGGDGTLHEVAGGAMARQDGASVGAYPIGSGNDYIKNFSQTAGFLDLERIYRGENLAVDMLDCSGEYAINLCNIGFDAKVADNMTRFKNIPFVSGKMAYTLAVLYCFFGGLSQPVQLTLDENAPQDERLILSVAANGICYGGGYYPTPGASVTDGQMDFCAMRHMSRLNILRYIGVYKKGGHLTHPGLKKCMLYEKCHQLSLKGEEDLTICMDGEISHAKSLTVNLIPAALNFWLPDGCAPLY